MRRTVLGMSSEAYSPNPRSPRETRSRALGGRRQWSPRRTLDPRRTRRVLVGCAVVCGINTILTAFFLPGREALAVLPPLVFALWYVQLDRRREVSWLVALRRCQVVAASLDDAGAHLDIWPASEEIFVVDSRRRRRSPSQHVAASLRTIAVPEPSPELLMRAREWLDDDRRIDVAIAVRVADGATRIEDVELIDEGFTLRYRPDGRPLGQPRTAT